MNQHLIKYLLFISISFWLGACGSDIQYGRVNEEKLDTNRLVKVPLATDFDEPMEMAITNDNRVIIIERKGGIKLYQPQSGEVKKILQFPVYSGHEDGLLGLALDPDHEKNNFIYLFYSPRGDKPIQRVSRFTMSRDSLELASEKILLDIPTQRTECCHSAGSLAFGPDGNLFIAVGDNTNPHNPGYYNSIDERKGREYWDAQRTAANTNDYRGKILRIHPEPNGTYTIPEGNLFPKGTPKTLPEIYVMGSRNPYRINVDQKNGWLYWGDVGQNTIDDPSRGPVSYDEWNVAREAGFFGWPYFAGPNAPYTDYDFATGKVGPFYDSAKPVNESVNNTGINILPAKSALIWYSYDESKLFPHLGTGGKSPISGPAFYTDLYKSRINDTTSHLHAHYNNKVFIAEWMRDWINVLTVNERGTVDSVETFMRGTTFSHPIDLEIGPDGRLYVLEYGTFWFAKNRDAGLYRIDYQRGNRAPVINVTSDKLAGAVPLKVQFDASKSFDPDSSSLNYEWYFDGDKKQAGQPIVSHTFDKPGKCDVRLVVTDKEGKKQEKMVIIRAGNAEPEITFSVNNGNRSFYWNDAPIPYTIEVKDKEDGSLQGGQIPQSAVKITLAYSTMGTDLAMVAQSHETLTAAEPDLDLIRNSDCKACHAMNDKSVGPSYMAIAEKYKNDTNSVSRLARKIIEGGSGVWGEHAMSAHPQMTIDQATDIVNFILSLNNDATMARAIAPSGTIVPVSKKGEKNPGDYILSVTYTDKKQQGVDANTARAYFVLRPPRVSASAFSAQQGVSKTEGPAVAFTGQDAWIAFHDIDLEGVGSINFEMDSLIADGGFSVRLDSVGGREIGSADISAMVKGAQSKSMPLTVTAQLADVRGVHDLYIVRKKTVATNTQQDVTLLRWLQFNRSR